MKKNSLTESKISAQFFILFFFFHAFMTWYGFHTGFGQKELGGSLQILFGLTLMFLMVEYWFGIKSIYYGIKILKNNKKVLYWTLPIFLFLMSAPVIFYMAIVEAGV